MVSDAICIWPRCDYSHTPKHDGHFVGHRQIVKIKLGNEGNGTLRKKFPLKIRGGKIT